jgi:hypothetical protein
MVSGSDLSRTKPAVMTAQWITASIGAMVRARRRVGRRQDGAADQREAPRERDAIEADHLAAGGEQMLDDVERDEAGGAGDQDGHVGQDSIRSEIRGCWLDQGSDRYHAQVPRSSLRKPPPRELPPRVPRREFW